VPVEETQATLSIHHLSHNPFLPDNEQQDMRRAAEESMGVGGGGEGATAATAPATPNAIAAERGALREHALALDASERDRDKFKALLRDAEARAEQLLAMNATLRTEIDVERAATDANANSGGGGGSDAHSQEDAAASDVLRASLLDAQRRLKETEAQLSAVSEVGPLYKLNPVDPQSLKAPGFKPSNL
jgi:hypothetical protein